MKIDKVFVPVDFSKASETALDYGVSLALEFEADLVAAHVVEYSKPFAYVFPDESAQTRERQTALTEHELRRMISERYRLECAVRIDVGDAEDEILSAVERERADLVVMGTHGRRAFERWILGSVTEHMLRRVRVPILTVSHLEGDETVGSLSEGRILYATDLSEGAGRGLALAHDLATRFAAELHVLHVMCPLEWEYGRTYLPLDIARDHARLRQDLERELEESIPEEMRLDPRVQPHLEEGVSYEVILDTAEKRNVDLIVLNLHGKQRRERPMLGTTAERVVRLARRPVLSIPAAEL